MHCETHSDAVIVRASVYTIKIDLAGLCVYLVLVDKAFVTWVAT